MVPSRAKIASRPSVCPHQSNAAHFPLQNECLDCLHHDNQLLKPPIQPKIWCKKGIIDHRHCIVIGSLKYPASVSRSLARNQTPMENLCPSHRCSWGYSPVNWHRRRQSPARMSIRAFKHSTLRHISQIRCRIWCVPVRTQAIRTQGINHNHDHVGFWMQYGLHPNTLWQEAQPQ